MEFYKIFLYFFDYLWYNLYNEILKHNKNVILLFMYKSKFYDHNVI